MSVEASGPSVQDIRWVRVLRKLLRLTRAPQLSPEEQKAVSGSFSNSEAAQASGIKLNGQKFFTLQADDTRVYGKKGVGVGKHGYVTADDF